MPCLNKESFHNPPRLALTSYPIPEYGAESYVNIVPITSRDLLELQATNGKEGNTSNIDFTFDLLSRCLVDDDGNRLFADADECKSTLNLPMPTLEDIAATIFKASGLDYKKVDDPKN